MGEKIKPWHKKRPKREQCARKRIIPLTAGHDKRIVPLTVDNSRVIPLTVGDDYMDEYADYDWEW